MKIKIKEGFLLRKVAENHTALIAAFRRKGSSFLPRRAPAKAYDT